VVRVVPRAAPVVIPEAEPETDVVIRDPDGLPPTALEVAEAESPEAYPVTDVGDGLTVTVKVGGEETPVRLLGVAEAGVASGNPSMTAEAFLRNLVAGEFVRLVADENLEEADEKGRRVAYLYRVPDGLMVNLELVRQGYAVTAREYAFEHLDAFLIYQRRARADHRGLWALVGDTPAAAKSEPAAQHIPAE